MTKLLIELDIDTNLKERINNKLHNLNIDKETYILDLIKRDINSKIYLENGFYFDYDKDKLFNGNQEINLTKNQHKLFKHLLDKHNSIVSSEELEEIFKHATKDSIRNYVMQLRVRTYRHLVKTISGNGYMILIEKNNGLL